MKSQGVGSYYSLCFEQLELSALNQCQPIIVDISFKTENANTKTFRDTNDRIEFLHLRVRESFLNLIVIRSVNISVLSKVIDQLSNQPRRKLSFRAETQAGLKYQAFPDFFLWIGFFWVKLVKNKSFEIRNSSI